MPDQTTDRSALRGDCAQCFGLCCVALPFSASADFAVDKPAGRPCANLGGDHRCGIHADLRAKGFTGCTVYDCFGAGQKVSQVTFGGEDWRTGPEGHARRMFDTFPVVRQLHELLWYLTEALGLEAARPVHPDLRRALEKTERLTRGTPEELAALDVAAHRQEVNVLLLRTSELARAGVPAPDGQPDTSGRPGGNEKSGNGRGRNGKAGKGGKAGKTGAGDRRGADLIGARLRGADLRGVSLRGAYLIAADLTGADLRDADMIGADLRDADLTDADLTGAFFLTQPQVNAARGSAGTRLPGSVTRPAHWTAGG
ncbi:pentapeptide repeat-containing protein [Streptomyces sp. WI03-4A]|uniref:pentapeptide repeat-containing protein n=1 Tax=Streptomyces sp. WI03-4A TaxID=3028706 RepID=UPI0029BDE641|nr:pentapeptide repeat-containing protein [Streptomyces sp. WI03-4A]MDX2598033.1 pentapeptide repeat-containing protein [Streptomyces sp. WI03-4A]